jgi:hypothetical protein
MASRWAQRAPRGLARKRRSRASGQVLIRSGGRPSPAGRWRHPSGCSPGGGGVGVGGDSEPHPARCRRISSSLRSSRCPVCGAGNRRKRHSALLSALTARLRSCSARPNGRRPGSALRRRGPTRWPGLASSRFSRPSLADGGGAGDARASNSSLSEVMPSASPACRARFGPRPGTNSRPPNPTGTRARDSSST